LGRQARLSFGSSGKVKLWVPWTTVRSEASVMRGVGVGQAISRAEGVSARDAAALVRTRVLHALSVALLLKVEMPYYQS